MIHNHRKGVVMSSLWRQSRSLKNESKISSATINKSKEPKGPVGFFDFIKQWWIFITIGSYLFMVSVLVYAYTDIFSGDIVNATDYVQYYVINNSYRVILFLIITIIPISLFFYPWFSLSYMFYKEPKGENKKKFEKFYKLINMYIKSFGPIWVISIVLAILCYILSLSSYSTTYRNRNQILSSDIEKKVSSIVVFMVIIFFLSLMIFGCMYLTLSDLSNGIIFIISFFSILLYIGSIFLVFRMVIFSYSGVSCVVDSYNSKNSGRTSLPVSYDTRGVHVFTGNYDPGTGKWTNVHREYLQFEKGYKVTSGVCESSSNASSISPPQGQQIP